MIFLHYFKFTSLTQNVHNFVHDYFSRFVQLPGDKCCRYVRIYLHMHTYYICMYSICISPSVLRSVHVFIFEWSHTTHAKNDIIKIKLKETENIYTTRVCACTCMCTCACVCVCVYVFWTLSVCFKLRWTAFGFHFHSASTSSAKIARSCTLAFECTLARSPPGSPSPCLTPLPYTVKQ